jgi:hypothetical protein
VDPVAHKPQLFHDSLFIKKYIFHPKRMPEDLVDEVFAEL